MSPTNVIIRNEILIKFEKININLILNHILSLFFFFLIKFIFQKLFSIEYITLLGGRSMSQIDKDGLGLIPTVATIELSLRKQKSEAIFDFEAMSEYIGLLILPLKTYFKFIICYFYYLLNFQR
jgi:hypothetical protein